MISHIQTLKEKYLRGWDRQATIILLASALLLMLHRYYTRRSFFRLHFAEYFGGGPLAESYPYYYWFLTTGITLFLVPVLVARFGTTQRLKDYGFQLGNQKLGWSVTGAAWVLMIPVVILAVIVYPPFRVKYPLCKVIADSWQTFLPYQLAYGVYMFSWEFFFRGFMLFGLERKFGNYSALDPDGSICGASLFKAVARSTRLNHRGYIAWCPRVRDAHVSLWRSNPLARRNDNGYSGCPFFTFFYVKILLQSLGCHVIMHQRCVDKKY